MKIEIVKVEELVSKFTDETMAAFSPGNGLWGRGMVEHVLKKALLKTITDHIHRASEELLFPKSL
jgi:AAA+ superfamily predicted ATPase